MHLKTQQWGYTTRAQKREELFLRESEIISLMCIELFVFFWRIHKNKCHFCKIKISRLLRPGSDIHHCKYSYWLEIFYYQSYGVTYKRRTTEKFRLGWRIVKIIFSKGEDQNHAFENTTMRVYDKSTKKRRTIPTRKRSHFPSLRIELFVFGRIHKNKCYFYQIKISRLLRSGIDISNASIPIGWNFFNQGYGVTLR